MSITYVMFWSGRNGTTPFQEGCEVTVKHEEKGIVQQGRAREISVFTALM